LVFYEKNLEKNNERRINVSFISGKPGLKKGMGGACWWLLLNEEIMAEEKKLRKDGWWLVL